MAGPGYRQALLYDDLARLKARGWDIEVDGVTRSYQESYGYDGFSRLASTTLGNGQVLRHLYNGYGFAAGEQDGAGTTLRQIQARDARDQIVRESYGNGVLSQRDYQPATGWLTRIQASKGGSVLQSLSYRYDGLGNLLERSDARGYSEVLSYDDLNRLLRSARTLDGTQVVQDFTYDALGNLTGKSGVGAYRYGSYSSAEQQLCAGRGGWPSPDRTPCAAPAPGRIAMTLAATSSAGRGDKSSTHRSINPWKFPQVPASAASPTIPSASATCRRWRAEPPSTWTRGVSRRSTTAGAVGRTPTSATT